MNASSDRHGELLKHLSALRASKTLSPVSIGPEDWYYKGWTDAFDAALALVRDFYGEDEPSNS